MEPKRWLDEHADPNVRRVLRAGSRLTPPEGAEAAAWAGLATALASAGAAAGASVAFGTAAASGKPSALGMVALAKLFGIGLGLGMAVSGATAFVSRSRMGQHEPMLPVPQQPAPARPVATAPPSHAASVESASLAVPSARAPAPIPLPATEESPSSRPTTPPANEESRLVLSAREALRRGEPERALAELERAEGVFGSSSLAQERLALGIDAGVAAGQCQLAEQRAALFLQRYPESPHSARFRALLAAPRPCGRPPR